MLAKIAHKKAKFMKFEVTFVKNLPVTFKIFSG